MRRVPPSPVQHFNSGMIFAIVQATFEAAMRCGADTVSTVAMRATTLYAEANTLSRLTITFAYVTAAIEAIMDILGNEDSFATAMDTLHDPEGDTTRQIVERANALFAEAQVPPQARAVAG